MKYISMFSGIEAASVAFEPLGWEPICFAEIEPFPSAVLAHRFPGVPNVGDITAHNWAQYKGQCDLVVGGPPCFVAGTLVLTKRGLIPIESVQVGDDVITHKRRWKKVLRIGSKASPTTIITGQGHDGLETTESHPFYAMTKKAQSTKVGGKSVRKTRIEGPEWIQAKDMFGRHWSSVADYPKSSPPGFSLVGNDASPPAFGEDFFWFVGAWLGDGCATFDARRGKITVNVGDKKKFETEKHLSLAGLKYCYVKERTAHRYHVSSKPLAKWLISNFGKLAHGKKLPWWVFGMKTEWRRALLAGYIFTNGTPNKPCRGHRISTISRELAFGAKMLAISLGHASSIGYVDFRKIHIVPSRKKCVIEGRVVNERPYYTITVGNSNRSSFEHDGLRFSLVRGIRASGREAQVYNLEVEDDNSYTADGIVVHNCQAFSMAGLRKSLDDHRGNLSLEYMRAIHAIEPFWSITENVPGWLSTKDNAFGCFLGGLVGDDEALVLPDGERRWPDAGVVTGPNRTAAWRILDAQFFGVAQRRRRVFVLSVRGSRNWACAEALFPLGEGLRRDTAPSRKTRAEVTPTIRSGAANGGRGHGARSGDSKDELIVPVGTDCYNGAITGDVAATLGTPGSSVNASGPTVMGTWWDGGQVSQTLDAVLSKGQCMPEKNRFPAVLVPETTHTLRADGFDASEDGTGRGTPLVPVAIRTAQTSSNGWGINEEGQAYTLDGTQGQAVAFDTTQITSPQNYSNPQPGAPCHPLAATAHVPAIATPMMVRRLTVEECEKLQGFPPGWTNVPFRGKIAKDGPRYKACGNSFAVPVVSWIGKRIQLIEEIVHGR